MTEKSKASREAGAQDESQDEAQDLDTLREEGLRRNPTYQTSHIDTSDPNAGPVDVRDASPIFKDAQDDAVRRAAKAVEGDNQDPTVIMPDDEQETERAKAALPKQVAELDKQDVEKGSGDQGNSGKDDKDKAADAEAAEVRETGPAKDRGDTKSTTKGRTSK